MLLSKQKYFEINEKAAELVFDQFKESYGVENDETLIIFTKQIKLFRERLQKIYLNGVLTKSCESKQLYMKRNKLGSWTIVNEAIRLFFTVPELYQDLRLFLAIFEAVLAWDCPESSVESMISILGNIYLNKQSLKVERAEKQVIIKSIWKDYTENETVIIDELCRRFKQRHLPVIVQSPEFHKKWVVSPTVDEILQYKKYDDPTKGLSWNDILQ